MVLIEKDILIKNLLLCLALLLTVCSVEAKINKADSDGLIDAFCHNDLSFKNKE
ncbi:hypothetical protein AADY36_20370 [Pseudoalteromonas sp. D15MCD-2]|uniref:hypothetical protein n=1 Tax=Pseudoalteromonas sp. D15MCD-2 TaxID=3138933 RepID=UPI003158F963